LRSFSIFLLPVILDLKYIDGKMFLITKVGDGDFVGVVMSAVLARGNGIEIPVKRKSQPEEKPEPKKKKQLSWQSVKTLPKLFFKIKFIIG
jgi:hypothetical protein